MKPIELLAKNHDTHFHSLISDGSHSVQDVTAYVSRWQESPKWAGLSDHSPYTVDQVEDYISANKPIRSQLKIQKNIELLTGMEWEWSAAGPVIQGDNLAKLDYCIASYHAHNLTMAAQVEDYYSMVAENPYSDIIGHPDKFLGSVNRLTVDWEKIFQTFFKHGVICEYNLSTPLLPEVFNIAAHQTEVNFTISSDMHDFRNLATRRVIDAWSESVGGGYPAAFEYLLGLIKLETGSKAPVRFTRLIDTDEKLSNIQQKLYQLSKDPKDPTVVMNEAEIEFVAALSKNPDCELDKKFFMTRLERFSKVLPNRIISLLDACQFKSKIIQARFTRRI